MRESGLLLTCFIGPAPEQVVQKTIEYRCNGHQKMLGVEIVGKKVGYNMCSVYG